MLAPDSPWLQPWPGQDLLPCLQSLGQGNSAGLPLSLVGNPQVKTGTIHFFQHVLEHDLWFTFSGIIFLGVVAIKFYSRFTCCNNDQMSTIPLDFQWDFTLDFNHLIICNWNLMESPNYKWWCELPAKGQSMGPFWWPYHMFFSPQVLVHTAGLRYPAQNSP